MHGQGLDGLETSGDPQEKCIIITCHSPSSLSIKRGLSALRWWEWQWTCTTSARVGSVQSWVWGTVRSALVPLGPGASARRRSQKAVDIWKETHAFTDIQWSGRLAGSGRALPPTPLLPMSPLPQLSPLPARTVHRGQDSPNRACPRSPAAGSGAGGAAGAGGAGRRAGSPPGECGAHSGSGAAATWAASPRRRGRSRNADASGEERGAQRGSLGKVAPTR